MCALFGSARDIRLIKKINNELLDRVIQQEVDYYKYHLPSTKGVDRDLYGEGSAQKSYYTPLRVTCLIERGDQAYTQDDQIGVDVTQTMTFRFLRDKLVGIGLVPAAGDIVEVRGCYYEIDQVNENQFIAGKDKDYPKSAGVNYGESLSIICISHYTRVTRLQIVRGG